LDVNNVARFRTTYAQNGNFGPYYIQTSFNTAKLNVLGDLSSNQNSLFKVGVKISTNNFSEVFNVQTTGTVLINKVSKEDLFLVKDYTSEYFKIDNDGTVTVNAN
jgi:hypothetical protein